MENKKRKCPAYGRALENRKGEGGNAWGRCRVVHGTEAEKRLVGNAERNKPQRYAEYHKIKKVLTAVALGCICVVFSATGIPGQKAVAGDMTEPVTGETGTSGGTEPVSRQTGTSDGTEAIRKNEQETTGRKAKKAFPERNRIPEQVMKNERKNVTQESQKMKPNETTKVSEDERDQKSTEISGLSDENETSGNIPRDNATHMSENRFPGSAFFRQAAENIWEKDCQTITAEEYAELTALRIDTRKKTVSFQLNQGMVQTMLYGEETEMDTADLAVFTGLEWLSIDGKLHPGDLQGLDRLFGLYTGNTAGEMAELIPHPEAITELGIADEGIRAGNGNGTGEKNLDGITHFPNLRYLSVNYRALEDISALQNFPGLQGLMLEECDALDDYGPLASLVNLEWLKIASGSLEEIDFLSSMKRLDSLSIEGSRVKSLDELKECAGLTLLNLTGNSLLEDYSVIGQLGELEELTLEMGHGGKLPSFEQLTKLERLSLKDVDDLSPLKDAAGVISLSLERCSGSQLEVVSSMTELDTLKIHRFSTTVESLSPLTGLPKLTSLCLQDVAVKGNIEELFGIQSLKSLYLDGCRAGLDFAQLPVNGNLEVLSMNGIRILDDAGKDEASETELSEHYELFDCFPNLTELYLQSLGLDNIAFAEKLSHLQHLDIRDNPVISLKELQSLEEIRTVWYGGGTIVFP